jgi:hypothetical protein
MATLVVLAARAPVFAHPAFLLPIRVLLLILLVFAASSTLAARVRPRRHLRDGEGCASQMDDVGSRVWAC